MILWIDADAAPAQMKEIVFRAGKRLGFEIVLVANQPIAVPAAYSKVKCVVVDRSADAADRHIVAHAVRGDVVITADIALAADLVKNAVLTIDPRGEQYTEDDVGERLSVRNYMDELRGAGMQLGGPRPYGEKDKRAFAATLDRILTRLLPKRGAS